MIDPQNQANKYIKNLGNSEAGRLNIIKVNDQNIIKVL